MIDRDLFDFFYSDRENLYIDHWAVISIHLHARNDIEDIQALICLTKYRMMTIQMWGRSCLDDEELASIRVRSRICHGECSLDMCEFRHEFVLERLSVDTLASHSSRGRVTPLDHEITNHPVENRSIVISLLRKPDEIGAGFRRLLYEELDLYGSEIRFDDSDSVACFWGVELGHLNKGREI